MIEILIELPPLFFLKRDHKFKASLGYSVRSYLKGAGSWVWPIRREHKALLEFVSKSQVLGSREWKIPRPLAQGS